MKIEQLPENAWERLRTLRLAALRDAPDAFGSTYDECVAKPPAHWLEQLGTLPTYVAVLSGVDVGMARGAHHGTLLTAAWLISMWVAPQARRRGVGRALVNTILDWARGLDKTKVYLDVREQNHSAISLYERCGFRPTGKRTAEPPPQQHIYEREFYLDLDPRRQSSQPGLC